MIKTITYHLTLFVIKLKGVKKKFTQSPINYLDIRKDDVTMCKSLFYKSKFVSTFNILESNITELQQTEKSDKLLIYIHGGAFISGPSKHHWDTIKSIYKKTNHNIWLCNYPKAPEHKISQINKNIDSIYNLAISQYKNENITLIGDSAGGTLCITLVQRLLIKDIKIPNQLILISPILDSSFDNPDISKISNRDVMLSSKGVISAKTLCADDHNLKNKNISPIYGDFTGFPKVYLFIAEYDISSPDQLLFVKKLNDNNIENEVIIGKKMPHIWPLLPVMTDAKIALDQVIKILNIS